MSEVLEIPEVKMIHEDGHIPRTVVTLPSKRLLAYGRNPHPDGNNEPGMNVKNAIDVLAGYDKVSVAGKGYVTADDFKFAMSELEKSRSNVDSYETKLNSDEVELYAPPRPADAVEMFEDMEIRNYARTLGGDARARFLHEVGQDPRLTLAFARDPLRSHGFYQVASAVWKARVTTERPAVVREHNRRRESLGWARVILQSVENLIRGVPVKHK